jgi:IS5 family transposase
MNPGINAAHRQQLSADWLRRSEVEGCFGLGKREYSLDLTKARLSKGAENSISMAFVVMCAEKIWRLLRLFFITIFAWLCTWQRPGCLWMGLRNIWQLETHQSLVTG